MQSQESFAVYKGEEAICIVLSERCTKAYDNLLTRINEACGCIASYDEYHEAFKKSPFYKRMFKDYPEPPDNVYDDLYRLRRDLDRVNRMTLLVASGCQEVMLCDSDVALLAKYG